MILAALTLLAVGGLIARDFLPTPASSSIQQPSKLILVPRMLHLQAGQSERFVAEVEANEVDATFNVNWAHQGVRINVSEQTKNATTFEVQTDLNCEPQTFEIPIEAHVGNESFLESIRITVEAAKFTTVAGCEPATGARFVQSEGQVYHDRLMHTLPSGDQVEFLLITPNEGSHSEPRPFYIMKHKVSNQQFREFAEARPELQLMTDNVAWQEGALAGTNRLNALAAAHANLPVVEVSVEDAYEFARWISASSGQLPTMHQWDKAAGKWEQGSAGREGPYEGRWEQLEPGSIAVDRYQTGPLPIGSASADRSPFGCHDMAGNGVEWTRDLLFGGMVPQSKEKRDNSKRVIIRGRGYDEDEPFRYADMSGSPDDQNSEEYGRRGHNLGFRVVIEP